MVLPMVPGCNYFDAITKDFFGFGCPTIVIKVFFNTSFLILSFVDSSNTDCFVPLSSIIFLDIRHFDLHIEVSFGIDSEQVLIVVSLDILDLRLDQSFTTGFDIQVFFSIVD